MKDLTITKHGLRVEGRAVLPGSRLILSADAPAHFSRFAVPTGGEVFEVATPKKEEPKDEEPGELRKDEEPSEELLAARAEYAELFGKPPHHRMGLERIREEINAKLEE